MNSVQLYLLSEKLMGLAAAAAPDGSALREVPPAARLVLADVGQQEKNVRRAILAEDGLAQQPAVGLRAEGVNALIGRREQSFKA